MAVEIFAGLSALKTAFDLAKGLKEIDDVTRRNAAIIDLQQKILDAQQSQQDLILKASALEKKLAESEVWEMERTNYELRQAAPGVMTYVPSGMADGEDPQYQLCPSCFHGRHKSLLVQSTWQPGRAEVLICHDCGWHAYVSGAASPDHKNLVPKPYRGS
jgi:hypothetical protein